MEIGFDEIEFTKLILKKFDENDPYYTNNVPDGKDPPHFTTSNEQLLLILIQICS